jgi:putative inorganic carbon (HCO3(-)) transporter
MGIFIFFNPFPHTTSIKEVCFYGSAIIVLILIYFKKIDFSFKSPLTLPFALFTAWVFIGLFFALDKGNSIHDFYAHLLKYLAIFYILINFIKTKKRFEILSWIIIISAGIFSIGGIIYFYIISGKPISVRMGFPDFASINNVGIVTIPAMVLSLTFFIKEKKVPNKTVLLICVFATLTASLLTQTIGTLIGVIFSSLILFTKNKKALIVFFLILFIFLGFLPIKNRINLNNIRNKFKPQNSERVKIWYTYLQIIKEHPIKGIGFGMRSYITKEYFDKFEQHRATAPTKYKAASFFTTHNMFVGITIRIGFIGLVLFLYIISMFVYMGFKMSRHGQNNFIRQWALCLLAVLVAYLTQAMFTDITIGGQLVILYTMLAMMTVLWRLNAEECQTQRSADIA